MPSSSNNSLGAEVLVPRRSPSVEFVDLTASTQRASSDHPEHARVAYHPRSGTPLNREQPRRSGLWRVQPPPPPPPVEPFTLHRNEREEAEIQVEVEGEGEDEDIMTNAGPNSTCRSGRISVSRPNGIQISDIIDLEALPPRRHDTGTQTRQPIEVHDTNSDDDIEIVSWEQRGSNQAAPDTIAHDTHFNRAYRAVSNMLDDWRQGSYVPANFRPRRSTPRNPSIPHRAHRHLQQHRPQWPPARVGNVNPINPNTLPPIHALQGFVPPGNLNYASAAFDLGAGLDVDEFEDFDGSFDPLQIFEGQEGVLDGGRSMAKPNLLPLPAVREGFTRDPREDDELVCPNCEGELCGSPVPTGSSISAQQAQQAIEKAKEVWVVRHCGHVYCGLCADLENRKNPGGRKGKAKDSAVGEMGVWGRKKLRECVVQGCCVKEGTNMGAPVKTSTKGDMFQIYL